jgi:HEPN domain-containing protein
MNKNGHIKYWIDTAVDDWVSVNLLFKGKQYLRALFFGHLTLEKLCKAHWVKDNESNYPPKIHNLVWLAENSKLNLSVEDMDFLRRINDFQLEGRYPDYLENMNRAYNAKNTKEILDKINLLRKCLLKELP